MLAIFIEYQSLCRLALMEQCDETQQKLQSLRSEYHQKLASLSFFAFLYFFIR